MMKAPFFLSAVCVAQVQKHKQYCGCAGTFLFSKGLFSRVDAFGHPGT